MKTYLKILEGAASRQRAVNWSIRITGKHDELVKMIAAMKKNNDIKDM